MTYLLCCQKLALVWHEAQDLFTEQEHAASAWSEELTRVSETHASDEACAAAHKVFREKNLVGLSLAIAAMKAINGLSISFCLTSRARA